MGSRLGRLFTRSSRPRRSAAPVNRPAPKPAAQADPSVHQQSSELLHRLKDVYVESTTDLVTQENPFGSEQRNKSKLPQDRRAYVDDYDSPVGPVPEGYVTYQQVLEIIQKSKSSKDLSTDTLASEYKLDKEDLESLLKYYGTFRVIGKTGSGAPPMEYHSLIG